MHGYILPLQESVMDQLQAQLNDIGCGICFERYDESERNPLSLSCGHTFWYVEIFDRINASLSPSFIYFFIVAICVCTIYEATLVQSARNLLT